MPRFKPTAVKPTIEGFSGFRPKQWAADLPELSALNLSGGHLKVRCTLEDWDAESLRDLFEGEDYAAVDLEATPEADLPVYADCLNLVAVGETAFSQRTMLSQGNYPDSEARSRWMKELHTFNLLLTTGEPEAPAGFMQFNSAVQWPRPAGLQPEAIADWGGAASAECQSLPWGCMAPPCFPWPSLGCFTGRRLLGSVAGRAEHGGCSA